MPLSQQGDRQRLVRKRGARTGRGRRASGGGGGGRASGGGGGGGWRYQASRLLLRCELLALGEEFESLFGPQPLSFRPNYGEERDSDAWAPPLDSSSSSDSSSGSSGSSPNSSSSSSSSEELTEYPTHFHLQESGSDRRERRARERAERRALRERRRRAQEEEEEARRASRGATLDVAHGDSDDNDGGDGEDAPRGRRNASSQTPAPASAAAPPRRNANLSATAAAARASLFALEANPLGTRLLAAVGTGVRIWDALSLEPVAMLDDAHDEIVTALCWGRRRDSNDGVDFISASLDKSVRLWRCSAEAGVCTCALPYPDYASRATLAKRRSAAQGSSDGKAIQSESASSGDDEGERDSVRRGCFFECLARLSDHDDWIRSVGMSPSGSALVSGSVSGTLVAWDALTHQVSFRVQHAHPEVVGLNAISGLEYSHGAESVFASGARDGLVRLWDSRILQTGSGRAGDSAGHVAQISAHADKLNNLTWSGDDRLILSSGRDGAVRIHDIRKLSSRLFSGFGRISNAETPSPRRRQRKNAGLLQRSFSGNSSPSPSPSPFHSPKASPAARSPIVAATSPTTSPGDTSVLMEFSKHVSAGYNVRCCFALNDRIVASGSEDGFCFLYDARSGAVVRTLAGSKLAEGNVRSRDVDDGTQLSAVHLVASNDFTSELYTSTLVDASVRVWSPQSLGSSDAGAASADLDTSTELHSADISAGIVDTIPRSQSLFRRGELLRHGTAFDGEPSASPRASADARPDDPRTPSANPANRARTGPLDQFMRSHGDAVLALFHKFNMTFGRLDWRELIVRVMSAPDETSAPAGVEGPFATDADRELVQRVLELSVSVIQPRAERES